MSKRMVWVKGLLKSLGAVTSAGMAAFQGYQDAWGVKEWALAIAGIGGAVIATISAFLDESTALHKAQEGTDGSV